MRADSQRICDLQEWSSPIDSVPSQVSDHGLGAAPVWFVRLPEIQAAVADGNLTIAEILAMPSLRKGFASQFESLQQLYSLS
jgi:hypothetical protein